MQADDKAISTTPVELVHHELPEMHENLQRVIYAIEDLMAEQHAANIMAMWRVGELLNEIETNPGNYLTEEQKSRHTSPSAILFNVYSKVYTPDQFNMALRLHDNYPSRPAIEALINKRCPTKPTWRLTASHVQLLLSVADQGQRKVIEDRCATEAYTTKALAVELTELHGKDKKKERGPVALKGLKQQVYDLLEHQRKFITRSEKLWIEDDGMYDDLMNASPSKLTDTIRGYMAEVSENFEKLRHIIDVHRNYCGQVLIRLQNIDTDAAAEVSDNADEDEESFKSINR
jgi:hypothetical protein